MSENFLTMTDMTDFLSKYDYKMTRTALLRYLKMGLCSSSLVELPLTYDYDPRKKYYHPLTLIEAMTAYHLFKGELVNIAADGRITTFDIGHEIDQDVFFGRIAFLASSGSIESMDDIFYFMKYSSKLLHTHLTEEVSRFVFPKHELPEIPPRNMPRLSKTTSSNPLWIIKRDEFLKQPQYAAKKMKPPSIIDVDEREHLKIAEMDDSRLTNSVMQSEGLFKIFFSKYFKEISSKIGNDATLLYAGYQRMIYAQTFIALATYYLPLICNQFFNSIYEGSFSRDSN